MYTMFLMQTLGLLALGHCALLGSLVEVLH